jgi:hypothetical protein
VIDLRVLDEWRWVKTNYGALYIAQMTLDKNRLEPAERTCVNAYLTPLDFEGEDELSFFQLIGSQSNLAESDRATITLAKHRTLLCCTNDRPMIETCEIHDVQFLRTFNIISKMNASGYKSKEECLAMVAKLISERNLWIKPELVEAWKLTLI